MECKNGVCSIGNETYEEMVLKKAIKNFGEEYQMLVAVRDLTVLIQGITDVLSNNAESIEEEIADAYIVLEQLRIMNDAHSIDEIRDTKIKKIAEYVW